MNRFYDAANARLGLNTYLNRSMQESRDSEFLGGLNVQQCTVTMFNEPQCFRMTKRVDAQLEEVVVHVPGILCSKTLPPIERALVAKPSHVRNLRQYVKITGLGSLPFDSLCNKIDEVHARFCAELPGQEVAYPEFRPYEGDFALDLHSRYFTERRYAPRLRHQPFNDDVDPYHILEHVRGADFIHAPDNEVQFLKKTYDGNNCARYETLPPKALKEGDLVECSFGFVAYPLGKQGGHKLVLHLRAVSLISAIFREKSESAREAHLPPATTKGRKRDLGSDESAPILKRKYIPTDSHSLDLGSMTMN
ncbi:hypothetical protein EST38_g9411 [Candolleomyces aberdarensis]|uniref:Uncharacterized protein n=1 Tax=Candolleomyces aberdarensis TaxID=2316362 RepID=A0A4Q2D9Z2_9AGAR|nr:hypothetical protein EST38_g9411 [Candolleomyces aberdarensis]